jgi:glycerol-3-phosphate acyltransferase PlsY
MMALLLVLAAYLIGGLPTSYLVAKMRGIDLRTQGSGNLGATNAYRVLGWKAAVPIFVVDIAKGFAPTWLFPLWDGSASSPLAFAYGAAAIAGHVFSPYVGFRGGKGVATGAGVFLALAPLAVGIGLLVWIALVAATGYVSVASMAAAAVLPVVIAATRGVSPVFWAALAVALFVVFAHRANIARLRRGEEHRFGRNRRAKASA